MNNRNVIDEIDYRGKQIIFTFKKWEEKSLQHPELKKKVFLKNIIETIKNPEKVWQDESNKITKRCYYKKYSTHTYIKVVIYIACSPCQVVTAFETNKIKEEIYSDLKQLK